MRKTDPEVLAAFAAAGLPVPVYDEEDTAVQAWRRSASLLGSAVHSVLACTVAAAQHADTEERRALVGAAVHNVVRGRQFGRLDKARLHVSSVAMQYINLYLPEAEVDFLGAERTLGAGRADLLWRRSDGAIWADEIKTWRHVSTEPEEQAARQIALYLSGGVMQFGEAFMGVRVLTLGNRSRSVFVDVEGHASPLSETECPLRLGGTR